MCGYPPPLLPIVSAAQRLEFGERPIYRHSALNCPVATRDSVNQPSDRFMEHARHILSVLGFKGEELELQAIAVARYLENTVAKELPEGM